MQVLGLNDGPFLVFTIGLNGYQLILEDHFENKIPFTTLSIENTHLFFHSLERLMEDDNSPESFTIHDPQLEVVLAKAMEQDLKSGIVVHYTVAVTVKSLGYTVVGKMPKNHDAIKMWVNTVLLNYTGV